MIHERTLETLRVAADIQHETSQDRGEITCTERTTCIFCALIADIEKRAA